MDETVSISGPYGAGPERELLLPSLGIVWHPDLSRIGAVAPIFFGRRVEAELSRLAPAFRKFGGSDAALDDRRISRSPIAIRKLDARTFEVTPPDSKMRVMVNGEPLTGPTRVSLDALGEDIIITLADCIVLSLFLCPAETATPPAGGALIGVSRAMQAIWRAVERTAPTNLPVLIRGETGTGKELVAQALHLMSDRAGENMVSVNMATLSKDLGAADLFGATKGAFTGAVRDRMGFFETASNSTIFLDEIGDTPPALQAMLLRILEIGEFRRVGETRERHSGARVLAATDRPLGADDFSQPLLRRLESMVIEIPPLRSRRVDIGIILAHFLKRGGLVTQAADFTPLITRMALYDWPGNVRELRNAVQQISVGQVPHFGPRQPDRPDDRSSQATKPAKPKPRYRAPASVSEGEMLGALDQTGWQIKDAAALLNISRTALYGLMERSDAIRSQDTFTDAQIQACIDADPDDPGAWARALRVPRGELERRIKKMMTGG